MAEYGFTLYGQLLEVKEPRNGWAEVSIRPNPKFNSIYISVPVVPRDGDPDIYAAFKALPEMSDIVVGVSTPIADIWKNSGKPRLKMWFTTLPVLQK